MTSEKETPKESTEVEMVPAAEEVKENEEIEEKEQENDKVEKKEVKESEEEDELEEDDDGKAEEEETKSVVKGSRSEAGELLSPRPTRERKMVERFTVHASPKSAISKHLFIDKGKGEQLKDIPNVAYKLSKRKADENLHLLHTILFGKKAKVHMLKKNIGHFSGFVWIDSEGKQRGKLKEKIDKCVKEKLLDFCDILNIPVSKATVKKEELSAKLLEFLECPCATTDVVLADKETGKKRKSNDPPSKSKKPGTSNLAGGKQTKKPKLDSESGKKRKHSTEEVDDDKSEPSQSEDDQDDDNKVSGTESKSDEKGSDSEKETDEDLPKEEIVVKTSSSKKSAKKDTGGSSEKLKLVDKKIPAKASNASGKSTKDSASSASKKGVGESESKSKKKALSTKKQETEKDSKMDTSPPAKVKSSSKSSTKVLKTDQGEGKSSKKAKKEPTVDEMQAVVEKILKEVDFNTATLSDILRKLGEHFGQDLMHRKPEVRDIITEVIKDMSDGEETSSESEDESGKDEEDA